jgi:hypothetical protein
MEINFNLKQFIVITLLTSIWVNISEVLRAVLLIFPRMKSFFEGKMVIGEMAVKNVLIWTFWDMLLTTILVFIFWLCAKAFGNNNKSIFISATVATLATIGIFWIATVNTGLGEWPTAFIAIFFAWIGLLIGAFIASKLYKTGRWISK